MNNSAVLLALASTASIVSPVLALADDASDTQVAELRALVSELQSQVDTLKAPFRGPDGEVTGLVSTSRTLARHARP